MRGLRDSDFPRTGAWPTSSTRAGYRAVFVNGLVRVEDGKHRGALPGHVLREA